MKTKIYKTKEDYKQTCIEDKYNSEWRIIEYNAKKKAEEIIDDHLSDLGVNTQKHYITN